MATHLESHTTTNTRGLKPTAWLSVDCIGERYLCFGEPADNDVKRPLYDLSELDKLSPAPMPLKLPVPPPRADVLDVVYVEGWNACCDAFFGGLPAQEPVVITVTERDSRVGELEEELREANAAYASQMRELHALKEELDRLRDRCRPSYDPADAEIEKLLSDK